MYVNYFSDKRESNTISPFPFSPFLLCREPSAKQGAGTNSEVKDRTGDCTKRPAAKSEARPLSDLQLLSASPPGIKPSEVRHPCVTPNTISGSPNDALYLYLGTYMYM